MIIIIITLQALGSVLLSWSIPQNDTLIPGTIVGYMVEQRQRQPDGKHGAIKRVELYNARNTYTAINLQPGSVYLFRVIPITGAGRPSNTNTPAYSWTQYTAPTVFESDDTQPSDVVTLRLSTSTAKLVWALDEKYTRVVDAFLITYVQVGNVSAVPRDVRVDAQQREYVLDDLRRVFAFV
jgi:hypothetical protein